MVPIIPNRSKVEGKIISVTQSDDIDDFNVLEIVPTKIAAVGNEKNFLADQVSQTLRIYIRKDFQAQYKLKKGSQLSAMVRKTPKNLFIIPDSVKLI